jgi:hypothetical protein
MVHAQFLKHIYEHPHFTSLQTLAGKSAAAGKVLLTLG